MIVGIFIYINIEKKFKQVKERVEIQKLLKPGEFEKLSKLERKRIRRLNREYTMLWVLGKLVFCCDVFSPFIYFVFVNITASIFSVTVFFQN